MKRFLTVNNILKLAFVCSLTSDFHEAVNERLSYVLPSAEQQIMIEMSLKDKSIEKSITTWQTISENLLTTQYGNIIPEQAHLYLQLFKKNIGDKETTICESGFFKGSSTALWQLASPKSTIHTFDMNFPQHSIEVLGNLTTSIQYHIGDSKKTIKLFQPVKKCGFISVDGSHDRDMPFLDLVHFRSKSECNATVVFDDTFDSTNHDAVPQDNPSHHNFFNPCSKSYWRAVKNGLIEHNFCVPFGFKKEWGPWPKGFCTGFIKC